MSNVKDTAQTTDEVSVVLERSVAVWPCPKCGRASKEHLPHGMRICAMPLCRTEFKESDVAPKEATSDRAKYPCPKCGRETKVHKGDPGSRICAMPNCRHEHMHPSGEHLW